MKQIRHALRHALGTWPANLRDEDFPDLADLVNELRGRTADIVFPTPTYGLAIVGEREQAGLTVPHRYAEPEYYDDHPPEHGLSPDQLSAIVAGLRGIELDNVILGFLSAPFVLVLLVDDRAAFAEYFDDPQNNSPSHSLRCSPTG